MALRKANRIYLQSSGYEACDTGNRELRRSRAIRKGLHISDGKKVEGIFIEVTEDNSDSADT